MPSCYLLTIAGGASLDRYSNNVTLFNLIEQLNFPKDRPPPAGAVLPLEIHAYFRLTEEEVNRRFQVRFALVASSGLETVTDAVEHRSPTPRFRTRVLGMPVPPVSGNYQLCVDVRWVGSETWQRDPLTWPLMIADIEPRPAVTH